MQDNPVRRVCRLALVASTALVPAEALGATISWINPAAGDWFDPVNWSIAVPTQADDASINNGGTAIALGAVTPNARSLAVGAGTAAVQTGTAVISELDLLLGNVSGALRVGQTATASTTAVGALVVDGSIGGFTPGSSIGSSSIGVTSAATASATGIATVGGNLTSSAVSVGLVTSGDSSSAAGTLAVGGSFSGLGIVGAATNPFGDASTATGAVTVGGNATLTTFNSFVVGRAFGEGSSALGTVEVGGTLSTAATGALLAWEVGAAFNPGASATGTVTAASVDTSASAPAFLSVGVATSGAASATGVLGLGSGDLSLAGSAAIGLADTDQGSSATGTVTLGGALATSGASASLQLGNAGGTQIGGLGTGSAEGSLTASGILGFRDVLIGTSTTHNGNAVTALGTATIGAGGIVTDPDNGSLRIGRANGVTVNGSVTGPGATAEGSATVAGDITGYFGVEIGHVVNTGTARGSLSVTGGTIAATLVSVGEVQRSGATIIDGVADAEGTLSVTNGAIVAEAVRIGRGSVFGGAVTTDSAVGTVSLSGSSLSTTFLEIGTLGGQGSLQASAGSSIAANSVVIGSDGVSGNGNGTLTLQNSTLTVSAVPHSFDGSMIVGSNGGDAQVMALASTIGVAGSLAIGAFSFDGTSHARMALEASTLAVGGSVGIGAFQPGSRGELALTGSTATVGGNVRVGLSANNGALFGEALLALDASLLDIAGTLTMDVGAETWFGIGGTDRGLGGYGAINALSAALDGLITVDFAELTGFDLASFAFDLIVTAEGILGDFDIVSLLNLPVGYLASYGITGDGEIWRVTLTQANAVPEPGTLALLLAGLAGLTLLRRRFA